MALEFSSLKFRQFLEDWKFEHITSPHPQSNGEAERHIQTIKNTLKKCRREGTDPYLTMLALRNTPVDGKHSPANIMFGRDLGELLPIPEKIANYKNRIRQQKLYYDRKTHAELPEI
ncbi:hypothetical protein JTB14_002981 [Gonioctena quinquepunctata]|nr:hypothetical protein JTB14_002981 [Gonioctena quinquepunctata]